MPTDHPAVVNTPPRGWACPKCGRVSYHPTDAEQGYCGACHQQTAGEFLMRPQRGLHQTRGAWRPLLLTYFGPPVDAPAWEDAVQAPTPVGQPCATCGEIVVDGDRGWITGAITATGEAEVVPTHAECRLADVIGHQVGACSCHMPDASVREMGRAAWDRVFGSAR